jgi:hypothetical protein
MEFAQFSAFAAPTALSFRFAAAGLLVFEAVPPPRLTFVLLGFFPELRRSPGRAPELVRAPRVSGFLSGI